MKDKLKIMEDASEEWVMECPDKRTFFSVIGDKDSNSTSCGASGREDLIVEAIVNEMLNDEVIADLILASVKVYLSVREEEEKKKKENTKKTTKIYS